MIRRALLAIAVLGAYVATIAAANWAISRFGAIPVGFGLVAPAGVYFAGLAFTLRDLGQDLAGRVAVVLAILAGSALSWLLADSLQLATASAVAFALSELVDFGIYTPLRKRRWLLAVVVSNVAGLVVDSAIFLWLAFGSFDFLAGQIVGKAWMTAPVVAVVGAARLRRHRASSIRETA
jgi:uncharacterized PurR-regulated membrane protein YhhQ (DUF165 family)